MVQPVRSKKVLSLIGLAYFTVPILIGLGLYQLNTVYGSNNEKGEAALRKDLQKNESLKRSADLQNSILQQILDESARRQAARSGSSKDS
mmetsp:Transcript_18657/g.30655  ORF Transcript_18657/g.30655 Transcript_18657/m.30655 type:complete len:90 (-) Transcript_18657:538-807(-)